MKHIDITEAIELARAAVEEKGADYVYERPSYDTCSYVAYGKVYTDDDSPNLVDEESVRPSCLVGNIVIRAGVDPLWFIEDDRYCEKLVNVEDSNALLDALEGEGILTFTKEASVFLYAAQERQDSGATWGEAVDKAEEHVNSLFEQ